MKNKHDIFKSQYKIIYEYMEKKYGKEFTEDRRAVKQVKKAAKIIAKRIYLA